MTKTEEEVWHEWFNGGGHSIKFAFHNFHSFFRCLCQFHTDRAQQWFFLEGGGRIIKTFDFILQDLKC